MSEQVTLTNEVRGMAFRIDRRYMDIVGVRNGRPCKRILKKHASGNKRNRCHPRRRRRALPGACRIEGPRWMGTVLVSVYDRHAAAHQK